MRTAESSWLRETAAYMLGRVEMNRQQIGVFDDYGDRADNKNADPAITARAEAALKSYLKDYPKGRYTASARGLLRRCLGHSPVPVRPPGP